MIGQIEDLVRKAFNADGKRGYFEPMQGSEMFENIFGDEYDDSKEIKVQLIRDLLLDYVYGRADREATVRQVCQFAEGNTLDVVELIGAVDVLRDSRHNDTV